MAHTFVEEIWPAILLAWVAGFVDALGYLALSHVFTAHMSGNSAALGAHLGKGEWHEALIRGLAIPPFILGVAVGVLVDLRAKRTGRAARLAPAFALELFCLGLFLYLDCGRQLGAVRPGTGAFFTLVSLLAAAMGLQSATLRRAGGTRVRTTYISGMLTSMTEHAVHFALRQWHKRFSQAVVENEETPPFGQLTI